MCVCVCVCVWVGGWTSESASEVLPCPILSCSKFFGGEIPRHVSHIATHVSPDIILPVPQFTFPYHQPGNETSIVC